MTSLDPQPDAGRAQRGSPAHLQDGRTQERAGRRGQVAVIAHDDALRASMCLLLDASGYAAVGYERIENFHSEADHHCFDCIIFDVGGATPAALPLAGRAPVMLPVVVLTVDPECDVPKAFDLSGTIRCLAKPVPPDELLATLERVIGKTLS